MHMSNQIVSGVFHERQKGHLQPVTHFHHFFNRIPGQLTDRRTPRGELNWIFTAVTDTIAWNTLPRGIT